LPAWANLRLLGKLRSAQEQLLSGGADDVESSVRTVRRWDFLVGGTTAREIVFAYLEERDPAQQRRLADVYRRVTGEEIEPAATRLAD
jgi:hypothetical protein